MRPVKRRQFIQARASKLVEVWGAKAELLLLARQGCL